MSDNEVKEFHVIWEIEVSASDPLAAAKLALEIQRDPSSTATVFDVYQISKLSGDCCRVTRVDLSLPDPIRTLVISSEGE